MEEDLKNATNEAIKAAMEAKETYSQIEKSKGEIFKAIEDFKSREAGLKTQVCLAKQSADKAHDAVALAIAATSTTLRIAEFIDERFNKDNQMPTPKPSKTIKEINEELTKIREGRVKKSCNKGTKCSLIPDKKPLELPTISPALTAEQIEKIKAKLKSSSQDNQGNPNDQGTGNTGNPGTDINDDKMKDGIIEDLKGPIEIIPLP